VHPTDWPYERAPLGTDAGPGWTAVAAACHGEGALPLAAVGHAGGQGSSADNQLPLWAPSRVSEVNSREVPKWMEREDIEATIAGFGTATAAAVAAGWTGWRSTPVNTAWSGSCCRASPISATNGAPTAPGTWAQLSMWMTTRRLAWRCWVVPPMMTGRAAP
jgi:hypothetical protein